MKTLRDPKPRFETKYVAVLRSPSGKAEGLMAELRRVGKRALSAGCLSTGEEICWAVDGQGAHAKVVWQRDNKIGLKFSSGDPSDDALALIEKGFALEIY